MTDWYVFSGATGTGAGTSWTNAMVHLAFAATSSAAGDRIFAKSNHSETMTVSTVTFPGTVANPNLVMSVAPTASQPPVGTDYQTGAYSTNNNNITINGSLQMWGFIFNPTGNSALNLNKGGGGFQYHRDGIYMTTGGSVIGVNQSTGDRTIWENTQFSGNSTAINITLADGTFEWRNTSVPFSSAIPTTAFKGTGGGNQPVLWAHGLDLSAVTGVLVDVTNVGGPFVLGNCRTNISVSPFTGTWLQGGQLQLVNCGNSGISASNAWHQYTGSVTTETTITLVSGATDGVTTISQKFSTTGTTTILNPLQGPPIGVWVTAPGNNIATLELITPTSFNNGNCWITVEALNNTSGPVTTFTTNHISNPVVATSPLSASSASWNSSPPTPTKYHLQCAFSTSVTGMVYVTPYVGQASVLAYFNPAITLTS